MSLKYLLAAIVLLFSSVALAAEESAVTGVVTNVNADKGTITIRNDVSGQRRTYFLDSDTRITSQGNPLQLSSIRRGHTVALRYRTTDRGREIVNLRVPDPDDVVEVIPVEVTEVLTMTGVVTGVRPTTRSITIRDDATRSRRTLKIPDDVQITRNGQPLPIRKVNVGDELSVRYRVTDQGLIIVTGRAPQALAAQPEPAPQVSELPKTAGNVFNLLWLAFGMLLAGLAVRTYRLRVQ